MSEIRSTWPGSFLFTCVLLFFASCGNNSNRTGINKNTKNETVKDIDGNIYHTVAINQQVWMVENLKVTKFNDGSSIPLVTDSIIWKNSKTPSYCWYNNDESTYKATYGALYNGYTIETNNLCPIGWHVSTMNEWKSLEWYLFSLDSRIPIEDKIKNVGFEAPPGGSRGMKNPKPWNAPIKKKTLQRDYNFTSFNGAGKAGHWWTSTYISKKTIYSYTFPSGGPNTKDMEFGLSVRCVKDSI